jgi:hypothetical protein
MSGGCQGSFGGFVLTLGHSPFGLKRPVPDNNAAGTVSILAGLSTSGVPKAGR